jgi:signal transduction histidine kinase/ligand-binding sensor domain-containing protein
MNAALRAPRWFGALAALLLASTAAAAPPLSLGSYQHTAFQKQDGAPGDVSSIAQTEDGFLWMAGTKGITRFDGVSFQPFKPVAGEAFRAAQLNTIFPAEGGGLWMANSDAGPTLLKDGHLTHFNQASGSAATVRSFLRGPDGAIWAVTAQGLIRFRAGAWEVVEPNVPGQPIRRAVFDSKGALWVLRGDRLTVRLPGTTGFVDATGGIDKVRHVFAGSSGRLYVTSSTQLHIYRPTQATLTETTAPLSFAAFTVQEDGEGAVWIAGSNHSVALISPEALRSAEMAHAEPFTESMSRSDGLSGNFAWPLQLDREGDLWVGTENGIDRFRRSAFTRVKLPDSIHEISAAIDGEGSVWVGSDGFPVLKLIPPASWLETAIPSITMATFFDAKHDTVWTAGVDALWSISKGAPVRVAAIGEGMPTPASTLGVASDSTGRVYIATNRKVHNVLAWDGHAWSEATTLSLVPKVIAVDANDGLWVGAAGETRLARIARGTTTRFDERQGLQQGAIRALLPEPDGLWIGGDAGIQHFDGKRFTSVGALEEDAFETTTGMITDLEGNLWIQTLDGVREIAAGDLAKALGSAATFVPYRSFDTADGVPGAPDPDHTLPTLHRSADGILWAQTTSGLAWIDPKRIPESRTVPVVYVEAVTSGETVYPRTASGVALPADARSFRIAYTSPMLSRPDKLRFRYRLVGYSNAWQDAGTRREAAFTNVPPGTYRFEVVATGEAGMASATPASAQIVRRPAYYETWWFRALGIVPVALLLWAVYALRMRTLTRRLRIRADEREAVARDIHDTLLQRFQGLMLTLQVWGQDATIPDGRRSEMREMSEQARDALIEGRERILLLRRTEDLGLALYDQIAAEGRRLQAVTGMGFSLEATGTPQPLSAQCKGELRDIAFETLRNAFLHSHGSKVVLALDYATDALWLVVTDDGAGFDKATLARARESGHFGLVGLAERVNGLAGTLSVESEPGEGTEVHIKLPARTAYAGYRRRWWRS